MLLREATVEAGLVWRLTDEAKVWVWLFFVGVAVAVVLLNLYAMKRKQVKRCIMTGHSLIKLKPWRTWN